MTLSIHTSGTTEFIEGSVKGGSGGSRLVRGAVEGPVLSSPCPLAVEGSGKGPVEESLEVATRPSALLKVSIKCQCVREGGREGEKRRVNSTRPEGDTHNCKPELRT